jgi:NitT/TauT family transport system substrate-binding protein
VSPLRFATPSRPLKRTLLATAAGAAVLALTAACATATTTSTPAATGSGGSVAASSGTPAAGLRLGYFANVTHTTPIVGVSKGFFAAKLGSTKLTTSIFNAGPAEMTALLGGQLDAAYVGPSAALNAWVKSKGQGLTIVAGAENAGAELVVDSKITSIAQLKGATIADPQLGNTQDVALRFWLSQNGYPTTLQGGGAVKVEPTANATALTLFEQGKIQGAWVPEPWASQLVLQGGGHVLVDEKSLWPGGNFSTTNLVVSNTYLKAHPQTVEALIEGQIAANAWVTANPSQAQTAVNAAIKSLTGKALSDAVIARSWTEENVTDDPEASSLQTSLSHAVTDDLLKQTPLNGIYDLTLLNQALTAAGDPTVSSAGLGNQ